MRDGKRSMAIALLKRKKSILRHHLKGPAPKTTISGILELCVPLVVGVVV
jgi:hypothetical protein